MTASSESKPERAELSAQERPPIPTVEEMETWDEDEVLRWIQQRNPNILEGDNLTNFKKECIIGGAFLFTNIEFYRDCGLPCGIGLALESLVDEVKGGGKLSNQTAGRKRKGDEIDTPELASPKRHRQEYRLWKLAFRASEQRKLVRETITALNDQDSNSIDKLSIPTFEHTFPFPFIGVVPERFKVVSKAEDKWSYMGRTMFKKLLEKLKNVQESCSYTTVWLHGTQGYGKSHLLAALVCYLAAQDERVVYIPDCRAMVKEPVEYLQSAMLFAWADDITTQKEIITLKTKEEIRDFFESETDVIFVVDQMNAFKESTQKMKDVDEWLESLSYGHKKVYSSSANNTDYLWRSPNSYIELRVYGGLNEAEMAQWWKQHDNIDRGGYAEDEVEDVTGCIPLLLDKCVVDGKIDLTVEDLCLINEKAAAFVRHVRRLTKSDPDRWNWYREYVTACFCQKSISSGWTDDLDLIDHRYFFQRNGHGDYTCGLVRNAVAGVLLNKGYN
jgi:hypothetical protein